MRYRGLVQKVEQSKRVGFCLDTCHIFAAGYDIRTENAYHGTMAAFDEILGLDRLYLIHLNDAKRGLGSKVDRHAHIGKEQIGAEGFSLLINDARLTHIPKILETPKKEGDIDWDRRNLDCLAGMLNGIAMNCMKGVDALIIETAISGGASILFTEDLQDGQIIE